MARFGRSQPPSFFLSPLLVVTNNNVTLGLTGVSATGSVGTAVSTMVRNLSGNTAPTFVGNVSPPGVANQSITGVFGTKGIGSLQSFITVNLTGVFGAGICGSISTTSDRSISLTGVSALSRVGNMSVSESHFLPIKVKKRFTIG